MFVPKSPLNINLNPAFPLNEMIINLGVQSSYIYGTFAWLVMTIHATYNFPRTKLTKIQEI